MSASQSAEHECLVEWQGEVKKLLEQQVGRELGQDQYRELWDAVDTDKVQQGLWGRTQCCVQDGTLSLQEYICLMLGSDWQLLGSTRQVCQGQTMSLSPCDSHCLYAAAYQLLCVCCQ